MVRTDAGEAVAVEGPPRRWRPALYLQVIIAIVLGVAVGALWPETGAALKPLGDLFIRLVRMVVAPLIFVTIVVGIAGARDTAALGRVLVKALAYFMALSTLALILGLVAANLIRPGEGMNIDPGSLDAGAIRAATGGEHPRDLVSFLLALVPETLVAPLASGEILQTLLVAVLFGIALALAGPRARPLVATFERLSDVIFRLVALLMQLAPLGAFGAIAFTIGRHGLAALSNLGLLVATFYGTAILFVVVVLGSVARLSGFSILRLIVYLRAELLLVIGTSSSEAALPSLMQKLEAAGCDREIVGLVVPTGYSFNLDGTSIYLTLSALFIAQATNVPLSLADQVALLLVAIVSSKGAAGVTGAGFITLASTLAIVPSVPVAGMALILGIDRFMSECRSVTNFIGNAVATIVVGKWQGAVDEAALATALGSRAARKPDRLD